MHDINNDIMYISEQKSYKYFTKKKHVRHVTGHARYMTHDA